MHGKYFLSFRSLGSFEIVQTSACEIKTTKINGIQIFSLINEVFYFDETKNLMKKLMCVTVYEWRTQISTHLVAN